ncbi:hypothetical protein BAUCODRAFT_47075, partial [Baudoinia panamericana UAMH 10762]
KLPRKLIICCDGTWQDSDNGWVKGRFGQPGHLQNPTNVTRIARAIKAEDDDHHPQIVYYQAGIGTGIGLYNHVVGGGTGLGLAENVREAYAFIANNYSEHDKLVSPDSIFLLGFSRGAFTARTLGGLICALGVFRKIAMPHFYEAFEDWERAGDPHYKPLFFDRFYEHHHEFTAKEKPDEKLARSPNPTHREMYLQQYFALLLKLNLTQKAVVKAIGVWDTVGALGIPVNPVLQQVFPFLPSFFRTYRWFDTNLHDSVENAFHALAMDERRFPFGPAVWERQNVKTNLEQVWFPGAHSNIGGSYEDAGMADITLVWMMDRLSGNMLEDREAFKEHDWIKFDDHYIDYWYDCLVDWLKEHRKDAYKGWARGKVYDSNTMPESLAGTRTRNVGRYHGTFYESGRTDRSRLLENTNEHVHSSVRIRMDLGARSVEPDWGQVFPFGWNFGPLFVYGWRWITRQKPDVYRPDRKGGPLEGWQLVDGHASHGKPNFDIDMTADNLEEIQWQWKGKGEVATPIMRESKLGPYERRLLEKDVQLAEKVEYTNNGW